MTSTQASDAIILKGRIGSKTVYGHDRDLSADGDFERGKIDGTESYYIVYSTPQYGDGQRGQSVVVDSRSDVNFGFTARSTQGWKKDGIVVMEHVNYNGTGVPFTHSNVDITPSFPNTSGASGASSFIVMKGVWSLYTGKNNGGTKIEINGVSEFAAGHKEAFVRDANDMIQSIKYVRDN